MTWRWAAASAIGTSHIHTDDRLQDAYTVARLDDGGLIAIVSDGAGSAEYGVYGAWLTCRYLSVRFREWTRANDTLPPETQAREWIDELRDWISAIAVRRGTSPRAFAATLAALFVQGGQVLTLHIGDSAIVARTEDDWDVLCWPENGEYASSTYFVTDDPTPRLNVVERPLEHTGFALFSDGVGELALSQVDEAAHAPFFEPMFRPVDRAPDAGRLTELSTKLEMFLAGPAVCDRTDDDKTLILISRS